MIEATDIDRAARAAALVDGFRVEVLEVAGEPVATPIVATGPRVTVGTHASNDLALEDRLISRFHCEITATPEGVRLHDLGSSNGSLLDGVRVADAWARDASLLRLGRSTLRVSLGSKERLALSSRESFGRLVGRSVAMRTIFRTLELAAPSESTVLVEGETGTGKELVAESIHAESRRRDKPFVVIDCGAIPTNLVESELFGHEKGSFTGATSTRVGAFEAANGGTLVLDELGELPLDVQPKLLRALENRSIQRVGGSQRRHVDVRVVACTNRDLRAEVNERRFRSDLYFRIAVVRVVLPPLRERAEDIDLLAPRILEALGADEDTQRSLVAPEALARLRRGAWPGNVRELRNHLERAMVLRTALSPDTTGEPASEPAPRVDVSIPFAVARRMNLASFERAYLTALLDAHGGDVAAASRAAGVDRSYVYRMLRRQET